MARLGAVPTRRVELDVWCGLTYGLDAALDRGNPPPGEARSVMIVDRLARQERSWTRSRVPERSLRLLAHPPKVGPTHRTVGWRQSSASPRHDAASSSNAARRLITTLASRCRDQDRTRPIRSASAVEGPPYFAAKARLSSRPGRRRDGQRRARRRCNARPQRAARLRLRAASGSQSLGNVAASVASVAAGVLWTALGPTWPLAQPRHLDGHRPRRAPRAKRTREHARLVGLVDAHRSICAAARARRANPRSKDEERRVVQSPRAVRSP